VLFAINAFDGLRRRRLSIQRLLRIGVPLDLLVMALTVAIAPIAFPF